MNDDEVTAIVQDALLKHALAQLDELAIMHGAGHNGALFDAIDICASKNLVLPGWAAEAFRKGYAEIRGFRKRTLDEAFGKPFKGLDFNAARLRQEKVFSIYNAIMNAKIMGCPVNEELFVKVARENGTNLTTCKLLYSRAKKIIGEPSGSRVSKISRLNNPKRRGR